MNKADDRNDEDDALDRGSSDSESESSSEDEEEEELPPSYTEEAPPYIAPKSDLVSRETQTPAWLDEEYVKLQRAKAQLAEAQLEKLQKEFQKLKSALEEAKVHNTSLQDTVKDLKDKPYVTPLGTKQETSVTMSTNQMGFSNTVTSTSVNKNTPTLGKGSESATTTDHASLKRTSMRFSQNFQESPLKKKPVQKDPQLLLQQTQEVRSFIEQHVGPMLGNDLLESIKTGVELCNLINQIKPKSIPTTKINKIKIAVMYMENINSFLIACEKLGISKDTLFRAEDLLEKKNIALVIDCLLALKQLAPSVK